MNTVIIEGDRRRDLRCGRPPLSIGGAGCHVVVPGSPDEGAAGLSRPGRQRVLHPTVRRGGPRRRHHLQRRPHQRPHDGSPTATRWPSGRRACGAISRTRAFRIHSRASTAATAGKPRHRNLRSTPPRPARRFRRWSSPRGGSRAPARRVHRPIESSVTGGDSRRIDHRRLLCSDIAGCARRDRSRRRTPGGPGRRR